MRSFFIPRKELMDMNLKPLTELDAVNKILAAIGEAPVNTLEELTNIDAVNAYAILMDENRSFQMRGWFFNKHASYVFNPDTNEKKIHWIDNILYLKGLNGEKLVKKGKYIYDMANQTDTFISPLTAEVVFLVPFDDMPEPVKDFITAEAALTFQTRFLGDPSLTQVLEAGRQKAWAVFQEYDMDINDYNMLDNTDVLALKQR